MWGTRCYGWHYQLVGPSIHHFGLVWNESTPAGWIVTTFCSDIHTCSYGGGSSLSLPVLQPAVWIFHTSCIISQPDWLISHRSTKIKLNDWGDFFPWDKVWNEPSWNSTQTFIFTSKWLVITFVNLLTFYFVYFRHHWKLSVSQCFVFLTKERQPLPCSALCLQTVSMFACRSLYSCSMIPLGISVPCSSCAILEHARKSIRCSAAAQKWVSREKCVPRLCVMRQDALSWSTQAECYAQEAHWESHQFS